jgi:hypothetical protein
MGHLPLEQPILPVAEFKSALFHFFVAIMEHMRLDDLLKKEVDFGSRSWRPERY